MKKKILNWIFKKYFAKRIHQFAQQVFISRYELARISSSRDLIDIHKREIAHTLAEYMLKNGFIEFTETHDEMTDNLVLRGRVYVYQK